MKFNSLKFVDSLEQRGFTTEQARGIAYGAFDCFDIEKLITKDEIKHLATKEDLAKSIHTLLIQLLGHHWCPNNHDWSHALLTPISKLNEIQLFEIL
jgi:hypothetical protein